MTGFLNAAAYSPLAVLFFGLATAAACRGLGLVILRALRLAMPTPLLNVVAMVLGIEAVGLAVEIVAIAKLAKPLVLTGLWCSAVAIGTPALWLCRPQASGSSVPVPAVAVAIACIAATVNLFAALAPSTKFDELFYHMTVPARIVADHGLTAYRLPIEAAVTFHTAYQIFAAPLHAMGVPDAPNVVSWVLSLMLVQLGWSLLRERGVASPVAYCLVAACLVGAYPAVFHVTGGSHALGDLSLATAVVLLATSDSFRRCGGPVGLATAISILTAATATSKLSLLPLAAAVLVLGGWLALRDATDKGQRLRIALALALPWLAFAAPLPAWSWIETGAPFGPFMTDIFGGTFHAPDAFARFADQGRIAGQVLLEEGLFETLAGHSPLIWLGTVAALAIATVPPSFRRRAALLLGGQCLLIFLWLPYDPRFLGGLPYGLVLCLALHLPAAIAQARGAIQRGLWVGLTLAIAPWLIGQTYYVWPFARVTLGLDPPVEFYRRYVAYFDDFAVLDRMLPSDAVLLAAPERLPLIYTPRPIFQDARDVPRGRAIFLFVRSLGEEPLRLPAGCTAGAEIYVNPSTRETVSRRPGVAPTIGRLHVLRTECG